MSVFDQAFEYMIPNEVGNDVLGGGYTEDPDDPGGATKWGVTHLSLDAWHSKYPGSGLPANVFDLTKEQAKIIYRVQYWDRIKGDQIANPALAVKLFDAAVNVGPKAAVKCLQKALNMASHPAGQDFLTIDGGLGPKTLEEVNTTNPQWLMMEFIRQLEWYYRGLNKPKYIKGWLARANRVPNV